METVNPESDEMLPVGEEGELVITNLIRRAIPRIRVRISDIAKMLPYEPCLCGRTHPKMSKIRGRMAHILNIGGKKFFPIDVEEVLGTVPELGYDYQIIKDKPDLDRLKIKVEYKPESQDLRSLANRIEEAFHNKLGIQSQVDFVAKGGIPRTLFKAQRVIAAYDNK